MLCPSSEEDSNACSYTRVTPKVMHNIIFKKSTFILDLYYLHSMLIHSVTCQPFFGLRNGAWLGSQLGKRDFRADAMTSHFRSKGMSRVFTWLPGDEPPSCQTATGVGDVT
jgi:hypothetical protein